MKTTVAKKETFQKVWWHVDATDIALGRLATGVATVLMGKHRPIFTPHVDTGDYVVISNIDQIKITGRKLEQRYHQYYTLYPGGLKTETWKELMAKKPEKLLELAVRRMLPKTKLGDAMFKKLKIFRSGESARLKAIMMAQRPETIDYKQQNSVYEAARKRG